MNQFHLFQSNYLDILPTNPHLTISPGPLTPRSYRDLQIFTQRSRIVSPMPQLQSPYQDNLDFPFRQQNQNYVNRRLFQNSPQNFQSSPRIITERKQPIIVTPMRQQSFQSNHQHTINRLRHPIEQLDNISDGDSLRCYENDDDDHHQGVQILQQIQYDQYVSRRDENYHSQGIEDQLIRFPNRNAMVYKNYPGLSRPQNQKKFEKQNSCFQPKIYEDQKKRDIQKTAQKKQKKLGPTTPAPIIPPPSTEKKTTCNCKQSKCLKLYCDCFNLNQLCGPECNCTGCSNNDENNKDRLEVMAQIIERNKLAFESKVQPRVLDGKVENKHYKGCNCKKSHCQKKYCECFQNGVQCSDLCKCTGCQNCETNQQQKDKKKQLKQFRMEENSQYNNYQKKIKYN